MRDRTDRHRDGRRLIVFAVALLAVLLASCGGGSEADRAVDSALEALPRAELWDPDSGEAVAKPVSSETLEAADFDSFIEADPARLAHREMAAGMGYPDLVAAGRVTYDNGAVMTTAALAGPDDGTMAMLVIGRLPGDEEIADPPEAVFVATPVYENGTLARVDFMSEKGELSLDVSGGEVELARAEYGSCAIWDCLAGAIYFWWEDNSDAMDLYWGTTGELCMDCIVLPLSQPVTCPLCAAFLGAPVLASVTDCTIWPCDLCISDDCHMDQYENQHCVTENGVSQVRASVTSWVCENPRTQEAECVPGDTVVTRLETCPWGCRPGSPTCMFATECMVGLDTCSPVATGQQFCVYPGDAVTVYQNRVCVASDDYQAGGSWGTCELVPGSFETRSLSCPYECVDGECQGPPSCEQAVCEQFEKPVGEPFCTPYPGGDESAVWQEVVPYGCVTVDPRVPVPSTWNWPEGRRCEALDSTLQVVEDCPGECNADGTACAPVCDPAECEGTTAGATSCAYDYRRYKLYQRFETSGCQPLETGGSACTVVGDELREVGLCYWGCTEDGAACSPDTGVPEAPGEFVVLQSPGGTQFMWTDNSPDEQGFRIYQGGCFATPSRPCDLIATTGPNTVELQLDGSQLGVDRCWEVRAFNATGESAPAWYCLPE